MNVPFLTRSDLEAAPANPGGVAGEALLVKKAHPDTERHTFT